MRLFLGCYDSPKGWFRDTLRGPQNLNFDSFLTFTRLWADRRAGTDRRAEPRRQAVIAMAEERRHVVDRRRGSERRSTLDRRGRASRAPNAERPVEHVRNALQLLREVALVGPSVCSNVNDGDYYFLNNARYCP